jgi:inhibitor of cysteine peptidase
MVGTGGTFFFKFRATRPGITTINLIYVRPWEKNIQPADTFRCAVEVLPPRPAPPHA